MEKINLFKALDELRGQDPCGIYLLTINNNSYVGSSKNIKKRLRHHRRELRLNIHDNKILQNYYNKYKVCEYSILELCDVTKLLTCEKDWIIKLSPKFNIQDPFDRIGGISAKSVYQYDLDGTFIKKWGSCMEASRELGISHGPLHSCANPNVTQSKSAYGFIWSYKKINKIKYTNNTGNNLSTKNVYLYHLNGNFYKEFDSLSDCARYLKEEFKYDRDWKNLRSTIGYALKCPKTRTVCRKYKVSYRKDINFITSIQ